MLPWMCTAEQNLAPPRCAPREEPWNTQSVQRVGRPQRRGHLGASRIPSSFSPGHEGDRQRANLTPNWKPCVLSAFSLAAPEISVVCGFLQHGLINSKCPELPKPSVPKKWKPLALVCAFGHMATGRVYLQLHDFPEVAHISFCYESEQATVYSPADARMTGGHSEETRVTLHIRSLFYRGHVSHKGFTCHLCSHDATHQILTRNRFDHPVSHSFFRNRKLN